MLRSGVRLRGRNRESVDLDGFESETVSGEELALKPSCSRKKSPPTKNSKIRRTKEKPAHDQPATEENQFVMKNKKKSKKNKKDIAAAVEPRRLLRGRRRLEKQENNVAVIETPKVEPQAEAKEENEDEEFLSASDFSPPKLSNVSPAKSAQILKEVQNLSVTDIEVDFGLSYVKDTKSSSESLLDVTLQTNETTLVRTRSASQIFKEEKRNTYEIATINTPEESNKRETFEIKPEDSFLCSAKKPPQLDMSQVTMRNPGNMQKKKISNVQLDIETPKIKKLKSRASVTDSGISTASKLLRRTPRYINSDLSTPEGTMPAIGMQSAKSTVVKKTPHTRSISKVKKVPNYAAIHKRAYEKMESIDRYVERKSERAKAMISGHKVQIGIQRPNKETTKKQLTFGAVGVGDHPSSSSLDSPKQEIIKKSVGFEVVTPQQVHHNKLAKTPIPTRAQIWNAYGTKIPKATAPLSTINSNAGLAMALKGVPKKLNSPLKKQVKSLITKSKPSAATVDTRRNHIKGVRSNRRFDLLMSMRDQAI